MESPRRVADGTHVLPSYFPIPGFGLIPVNAFVIEAAQPVLVDTGLHPERDQFLDALRSIIDPADLRWLWLTHPDPDHTGSLRTLLGEAPRLKLVTTFLGAGMLSLVEPIPPDRLHLLNPGESLDAGDRRLTALRPPTFDNPATTALFDQKTRALFSSDCFGAVLQEPAAEAESLSAEARRQGQALWTSIDSPWLHNVDVGRFEGALEGVRSMAPAHILSSHLPPARTLLDEFIQTLASVPGGPVFTGPNQAQLEAMLAGMKQEGGAS